MAWQRLYVMQISFAFLPTQGNTDSWIRGNAALSKDRDFYRSQLTATRTASPIRDSHEPKTRLTWLPLWYIICGEFIIHRWSMVPRSMIPRKRLTDIALDRLEFCYGYSQRLTIENLFVLSGGLYAKLATHDRHVNEGNCSDYDDNIMIRQINTKTLVTFDKL